MSFDLVHAAFSITNLSGPDKATLLALCDHAHNDGTGSYASVHVLAGEASLGDRTVQRALKSLEAQRFIATEGLPADWRTRTQEEFVTGGRRSQTVSYRILIPSADIVEAAKHRAKVPAAPDYEGPTGAAQAPLNNKDDGCHTGTPIEDGCHSGTRGVPQRHERGATAAPKAVREAVREEATTTTVEVEGGLHPNPPGTSRADSVISWLVNEIQQPVPAGKKLRAALDQILASVSQQRAQEALTFWIKGRSLDGLHYPAHVLVQELPAAIYAVNCRAKNTDIDITQEMRAQWRKDALAQAGYTEAEWAEEERKAREE